VVGDQDERQLRAQFQSWIWSVGREHTALDSQSVYQSWIREKWHEMRRSRRRAPYLSWQMRSAALTASGER
jgi:hypothetical protein